MIDEANAYAAAILENHTTVLCSDECKSYHSTLQWWMTYDGWWTYCTGKSCYSTLQWWSMMADEHTVLGMNEVWWLMNILYRQIMPQYTTMMKYDGWWTYCTGYEWSMMADEHTVLANHTTAQWWMKYDGWWTYCTGISCHSTLQWWMKYDGWWPCCSRKSCHSTLKMMKYDGWPTSRVTIQRFTILLKHLNYAITIFREKNRYKHVHKKTALFRTLDTAYSCILSKTDPHCPAWGFSCTMQHTECRRQPTVVYQVRSSLSCKELLWHWNTHRVK